MKESEFFLVTCVTKVQWFGIRIVPITYKLHCSAFVCMCLCASMRAEGGLLSVESAVEVIQVVFKSKVFHIVGGICFAACDHPKAFPDWRGVVGCKLMFQLLGVLSFGLFSLLSKRVFSQSEPILVPTLESHLLLRKQLFEFDLNLSLNLTLNKKWTTCSPIPYCSPDATTYVENNVLFYKQQFDKVTSQSQNSCAQFTMLGIWNSQLYPFSFSLRLSPSPFCCFSCRACVWQWAWLASPAADKAQLLPLSSSNSP